MKKVAGLFLILALSSVIAILPAFASGNSGGDESPFSGIWQGKLKVSGMELRIVFHIKSDATGQLAATMDSPDQGAAGIPVSAVKVNGDSIRLEVQVAQGYYTGKLNRNSGQIEGSWHQSGMNMALNLKKIEKLVKPKRPQEPKKPYPYKEEEVSFFNAQGGDTLAGTLTLPRQGGPFPAAVLISGSGPQDRDESLMGHKPFWILADYLTRRGIAVLRFDDRGVGKSTGKFSAATSKDFATDVEAGIDYLKSRKEIAPGKIGLIGHSEGGLIAPMVAAENSDVAFIVLMAGPGLPGADILQMQSRLILEKRGVPENLIAKSEKSQEKLFRIVEQTEEKTKTEQLLVQAMREAVAQFTPEQKKMLGISDSDKALTLQARQLSSPWFRFFLKFDPRSALRKVKCPVLAVNGGKDVQVPPKKNLEAIRMALTAGGNPDFTIKELPGLNHLLQTAKTGLPDEYGKIEETISPRALNIIADWIARHTGLLR